MIKTNVWTKVSLSIGNRKIKLYSAYVRKTYDHGTQRAFDPRRKREFSTPNPTSSDGMYSGSFLDNEELDIQPTRKFC